MTDKPIPPSPDNSRLRLGRPPLPRDKARAKRVVTFVTETELAKLQVVAAQSGQSVSAAVHGVLERFLRMHGE
jgi:hypothetical protein